MMSGSVLVVAEQRLGQLNPVSLETLVAGQRAAAAHGLSLVVALVGAGVEDIAGQLGAYQMDRLMLLEHELLEPYGPEAYCDAVASLIRELNPDFVFFPHSYQGRDFAPRLAARFGRSLISDCVDIRSDDGQLVCVRQVFQGKLHADVVPVGEPPHFVSFQAAAFGVDELAAATGDCVVEKHTLALNAPTLGLAMEQPEIGRAHV